jgi:HPt (histidine-containing phosphotransfer) domain-containing protein
MMPRKPRVPTQSRLTAIASGSGCTHAELLDTFRRTMAEDLLLVREAVGREDFHRVGALAHRISGACLMLGAGKFTLACASLSFAAEAASAVRAESALARFERELAALDDEQESWL